MIEDGLDPIRHKLTNHIIPSIDYARIIAPFFNVTAQQVVKSLESMKFYNDLLIAPSKLKRKFIYALLRITGNYQKCTACLLIMRLILYVKIVQKN